MCYTCSTIINLKFSLISQYYRTITKRKKGLTCTAHSTEFSEKGIHFFNTIVLLNYSKTHELCTIKHSVKRGSGLSGYLC